jgi:hypothetical protein
MVSALSNRNDSFVSCAVAKFASRAPLSVLPAGTVESRSRFTLAASDLAPTDDDGELAATLCALEVKLGATSTLLNTMEINQTREVEARREENFMLRRSFQLWFTDKRLEPTSHTDRLNREHLFHT